MIFAFPALQSASYHPAILVTMTLNRSLDYDFTAHTDKTLFAHRDSLSSLLLPVPSHPMIQWFAKIAFLVTSAVCLRPALGSLFILSFAFIFNYVAYWLFFQTRHWSKKAAKTPPTIPHLIPFVGSSLSLGFNALEFVKSSTYDLLNPANARFS